MNAIHCNLGASVNGLQGPMGILPRSSSVPFADFRRPPHWSVRLPKGSAKQSGPTPPVALLTSPLILAVDGYAESPFEGLK